MDTPPTVQMTKPAPGKTKALLIAAVVGVAVAVLGVVGCACFRPARRRDAAAEQFRQRYRHRGDTGNPACRADRVQGGDGCSGRGLQETAAFQEDRDGPARLSGRDLRAGRPAPRRGPAVVLPDGNEGIQRRVRGVRQSEPGGGRAGLGEAAGGHARARNDGGAGALVRRGSAASCRRRGNGTRRLASGTATAGTRPRTARASPSTGAAKDRSRSALRERTM